MLLYVACLLLLPGILLNSSVSRVNAAPTTYDQRQTGDFNLDAKFENFLFIIATSGSHNPFNNLAAEALQLSELFAQRSKQQAREKPPETMIYETEDEDGGKAPYHVEIIGIDKGGNGTIKSKQSDRSETPKIKNASEEEIKSGISLKNVENSVKILEETPITETSTDGKKIIKKSRSLRKSEEERGHIDNLTKGNKRPVEIKNSQMENLDQSDDLPVKEEASKAARPGISLKKQLSKKKDEDVSFASEERNELDKYQELVLLGGGIENCGPGRYRDKLGVCQRDINFN